MEIITGVERRRRWRCEEKLRIVAEVERPGASFAAVARRHEVSRGLLWKWRRQVRAGVLAPEPMPTFVPVQVSADVPSPDRLALPSPLASLTADGAYDGEPIYQAVAGRQPDPPVTVIIPPRSTAVPSSDAAATPTLAFHRLRRRNLLGQLRPASATSTSR